MLQIVLVCVQKFVKKTSSGFTEAIKSYKNFNLQRIYSRLCRKRVIALIQVTKMDGKNCGNWFKIGKNIVKIKRKYLIK